MYQLPSTCFTPGSSWTTCRGSWTRLSEPSSSSCHLAVWLLRCQARMKQKQHMEKSDKPRSQWLVVWSYCTLLSMSDGDEFCGYFMIFDGDMFMKYVNRMLVGTRW